MQKFVFAALVVAIAGCSTTKGPRVIFSANGPEAAPNQAQPYSLARAFVTAANKAACSTSPASSEQVACPELNSPDAIAAQEKASTAMFDVGTSLVYANCSEFFNNAGRTQTQLMVWKDAIGLLGTFAAGVIALDGGGTGDLDRLAVISLGSSAALSGIDVYTQRFLFAAENVDSVRELTLNALNAHAEKVKENPPKSYTSASRHLLDNQALCLPPRIAMMARDAIKNGQIVAYTASTGPAPELAETNDRVALQDIGDRVGLAGPLTMRQASGYYWLLVVGASKAEQDGKVQALLSDIPMSSSPFNDKAELKAEIPHREFIRERLGRLSVRSTKVLTDIINAEKRIGAPAMGPHESPADIEKSRVRIDVR